MFDNFYRTILLRIRQRKTEHADGILSGDYDKFEMYKSATGKLKGLDEAEQIIVTTYRGFVGESEGSMEDERCNEFYRNT